MNWCLVPGEGMQSHEVLVSHVGKADGAGIGVIALSHTVVPPENTINTTTEGVVCMWGCQGQAGQPTAMHNMGVPVKAVTTKWQTPGYPGGGQPWNATADYNCQQCLQDWPAHSHEVFEPLLLFQPWPCHD